jgi:superfamily II DNA or RNA helicase
MLTLKISNSKVELVTDDDELLKRAKKLLKISWRDHRDPTKFLSVYLGRGNFFPRGFLAQFENRAKKKHIDFITEDLTDPRVPTQKLVFECSFDPKEHQNKARQAIDEFPMGIVSSPTASGKSLMIALAIADKQTTTLLITPSTVIRDQFVENLREWFGDKAVTSDIPVLPWAPKSFIKDQSEPEQSDDNDNPFDALFKPKKTKVKETPFEKARRAQRKAVERKLESGKWIKPITVLCWNSLPQLPKEFIKNVGCIIIDECHTSSVAAIRDLLYKAERAYYRYGFSATPWRDQPHMFRLMQSALGSDVIFDYSPTDAIEDDVIAKPNLNIIESAFPTRFMKGITDYRTIVDDGIIRNKARNLQIVKKAIELVADNHQVFIAIDEVGHFRGKEAEVGIDESGNKITQLERDVSYSLKSLFAERDQEVVFISGLDSPKEKAEKISSLREHKGGFILIGTMAAGIGTDIPGIDKIISAATGKSSIRFIQRIGRGLRTNNIVGKQLEVFDFIDRWNAKAKKFSILRIETFRKVFKNCKVFGY